MSYHDKVKKELVDLVEAFNNSKVKFDQQFELLKNEEIKIEAMKDAVVQMAKERQVGFPVLAKAYEDYFKLQDKKLIDFFSYKDKPAMRAGEILAEYARNRREILRDKKIYQYLVEYYENICPFLIDLREEVEDMTEEDKKLLEEYSEEEREDGATLYLTKEEYRKLSVTERNQLALDRYWKRPKSKWYIGKIYERFIGFLYEKDGYEVDYTGIGMGLGDLGRDIIAKKGKEIIVIQCKNWSKFRQIYEKHIFQFFGTVFQYKDENKDKKVRAIFYTTTQLSELARRFGQELGIELQENYKFDIHYPCIKCNISRPTNEKIYHLPFDQQYDTTKITPGSGERYCATVKEAEAGGFRRAFRWRGENKQK